MGLRSKLFWMWCTVVVAWWLVSDAGRIALKFQIGGWRAAYVPFLLSLAIGLVIVIVPVLIGRIGFRVAGRVETRDRRESQGVRQRRKAFDCRADDLE